jgi:hypothetical protein
MSKRKSAISFDVACVHLPRTRLRAAQSTFDALHYELRSWGLAALEHPNCRHRLVELSPEQLRALMVELIRIRSKFTLVTDELLIALDKMRQP